MNSRTTLVRGAGAAALTLAALLAAAGARAACTRVALPVGELHAYTATPTVATLSGSSMTSNWLVVGVIPAAGEDWDLGLYSSPGDDVSCGTGTLATSNWGNAVVDVVVGDGSTNAHTDVYARLTRYSGTGSAHSFWTASPVALSANGPLAYGSADPVIPYTAYTASLTGGTAYRILFTNWSAPGLRLLIFRNPGTGTYWTGRSGALVTLSGESTWTPPATANYLFVLVNDAHETGSYMVGIGACPVPVALTSDVAATTTRAYDLWSVSQTSAYWAAFAVRGATSDYDLKLTRGVAGPGYPHCVSDSVIASEDYNTVNVVVGDFNHSPTGTYDLETSGLVGGGGAVVEYEGGAQTLTVDAAPVTYATGPNELVRCWDVALTAGQTYNFTLSAQGTAAKLLLFRNPASSAYYAKRSQALFETSVCRSYTAPATDFYAAVVVNDDAGVGAYTLGVSAAPCPCPTYLSSGSPVSPTGTDAYYSVAGSVGAWSVMAVRGQSFADDWDLSFYGWQSGAASPTCFGNSLAGSGYGADAVDLVTMDLNPATVDQRRWARAHHSSGSGTSGRAEWRTSTSAIGENDPWLSVTFGAQDLVRIFDAAMTAGIAYTIEFDNPGGVTLLVYQNPTAGIWHGSRASIAATGTSTFTYTPTRTGDHAIVLANDGIVAATVRVRYGRCPTPTALANRTAATAAQGTSVRSFTAPNPSWLAVGVQSSEADWDMSIGSAAGSSYPGCVTPTLASSQHSGTWFTDFVVNDQHHSSTGGTYYFDAHQASPAPLATRPLWLDQGGTELLANQYDPTYVPFGTGELLKTYDLALEGGVTYTVALQPFGYSMNHSRLLLFRNPGSGVYWAGRSAAVLDVPIGDGSTTFTAPATDVYGAVVVDDGNGNTNGTDKLTVGYCPTPTALASGVSQTWRPTGYLSFTPTAPYWTAIAVRSTGIWTLEVDSLGSGNSTPYCTAYGMAQASGVPTSLVVGDFNFGGNSFRTWYARVWGRGTNPPAGLVQWSGGAQQLVVNAPPVVRSVPADFLVEIWDVYLTVGTLYGLNIQSTGLAACNAYLFGNPGGVYWAPSGSALFITNGHLPFTPPRTGWYGLAVMKTNVGAGGFQLSLASGELAAEPAPPVKTTLRAIAPNPARGAWSVEYALHTAASVRLDLLDTAGRLVATLEDGARPAGTWRVPYTGTASGGALPPGVYLVRLRADGRTVGERKLALIR